MRYLTARCGRNYYRDGRYFEQRPVHLSEGARQLSVQPETISRKSPVSLCILRRLVDIYFHTDFRFRIPGLFTRCINVKFCFQNAFPASAKRRRKGCRPISVVLESDRAGRMGEGSCVCTIHSAFQALLCFEFTSTQSTLIRGQFSVSGQDNEFRFAAYFRAFRCARVCFMSTSVALI